MAKTLDRSNTGTTSESSTSTIVPTTPRTASEVRALVEARRKERDSWLSSHNYNAWEMMKMLANRRTPSIPKDLHVQFPVSNVDFNVLRSPPSNAIQLTWIGHSTVLVQLYPKGSTAPINILTDPVFSDRCSGVQFAGPKRFTPPACTVQDLVENNISIHVVLLTHNHYDHLDYNSMWDLSHISVKDNSGPIHFVVPLGLRSWFQSNCPESILEHHVTELDWHETCVVQVEKNAQLDVTAVPMQHWSSRRGIDRDTTLWCGFSLSATNKNAKPTNGDENKSCCKALFSCDTGLFEGLQDIGKTYGPFHVAMIPIGAYEPHDFMKYQHINPEEAVEMMQAVRAKQAMPIHWGTFVLAVEPVLEPREKLAAAVQKAGLDCKCFPSWCIGDSVSFDVDSERNV